MRKLFTLLILLFLWAGSSWAQGQVNLYSFASSSGSYTTLSTETVLWSAAFDDENSTAITIPSFSVNSVAYTTMFVQANGWITLGGTTIASSYTPISSSTSYPVVISAFGRDLNNGATGTPKISYNTNDGGDIVVQYQDVRRYNIAGELLSFQIRLTPATGNIKIVYGGTITAGVSTSYPQVGLRGATNAIFNNRTSTTTWTGTTAGGTNAATINYSSTVLPTAGLTYTFTPPLACANPTNQPTALVLTPLTTSVSGTFTAAAGSDSYLVVRTPDGILTANPVNSTTYAVGAALGNGTVVSVTGSAFTATGLTAGTLYYFHVFSQNSLCSGGPLYLTTSPLVGSVTTAPNPPASITAAAISGSQIDLTTIANVAGNNIMIAYSFDNVFGTPSGTYTPGNPIPGGGIVVNTGAAGVTSHTGLMQGTQYYYRAWSVAGGVYSSTTVSANTVTLCTGAYNAPYIQTFEGLQWPVTCWSRFTGVLAAPSTLTTTTLGWIQDDYRNVISPVDKAAKLNIYGTALNYWFLTPQINLGTGTYQLEFDLSLNAWNTSGVPATTGIDDKFAVVISTDGGTTWTSANTLRLWDNAGSTYVYNNINPNGERVIISLSGYSGTIMVGFYGESTVSNADNDLMINNMAIVTPPACNIPTGLTATAVGINTASIGWIGATTVEIDYAIGAHTPGSGTIVPSVTANPYGLAGLTGNSTYYVHVRQNCGAGTFSAWAGPVVFTTLCDVTTAFIENFDAVITPALPSCWAKVGAGGSASTQTSSPNSVPNCLYIYSSSALSQAVVSMPGLSNAGANTHQLKFKARGNLSVGGVIEVGYLTNPLDAATFVSVQSFTIGALTYSDYICVLGTAPGANQVLAFRHSGVPANSVLIDDVAWELQPACAQPSALTATGITGSSAILGWNANLTTAWDIEWGAAGFTQGTGTTVSGVTNPYTLSGLTPVTPYSYYVRANCGGSGYSLWTGPYNFTTTVACPAPTTLVVTGILTNQASLGWTNAGGSLWNIEWGPSGFVQGTGTLISTASNPYLLTGLSGATAYSWYVQQDCGGSTSTWAGPNTFTTQTIVAPPYSQEFIVTTTPAGWDVAGWLIGSVRGVTGNPGNNIYKNLYSSAATGTFSTVNVGPVAAGMVLSFDYKLADYGTPFAPPAIGSGDFILSVSTDFGATYTALETVANNGVAGWQSKLYNLTAYVGSTIKIKVVGNWVSGDYDLAFDNIRIQVPPTCNVPTGILASAITANTATIGWTAPSPAPASGYQWEVRTSGAGGNGATGLAQSGSTTAGTVSANVAGLISATTYNVYVRSNCGGGDFSSWAGPTIFSTSCGTYTTPLTQNFDAVTTPAIPLCWTIYSSAALRPWLTQSTTQQPLIGARSEPNFAAIFYSATAAKNEWLVSPGVQLTAGIAYRAKFFVKAPGFDGVPESMKLTVSTDPSLVGVTAGTVIWNDPNMLYASYTEFNAPFTPTTTGIYYFAWHAYSVADVDYIAMDDIAIELVPACDSPSAIIATAVTETTATISWTASISNPSGGYEYEVRTSGAGGSGATGLFAAGTTVAGDVDADITGMASATEYFIYVRSNCGAGTYSTWASGSFSTLCGVIPTPFTETVEIGETSPCWTAAASAGGYNWQIVTGASGYALGNQSFRANFYSILADEEFTLYTPEFDASTLTSPQVEFDYAYATYSGELDEVDVYYSTDGGTNFTLLLAMPGGTSGILNTAGTTTSNFVPTATDWATMTLALPAGTNMVAFNAISQFGNNMYLDNIKINSAPIVTKTINLSNVMLEGLYAGGGTMNQAQDDSGPKFGTGVADIITVELHNATTYGTLDYPPFTAIELSTTGTATVTGIPAVLNGNYYVTIKHRNSIEITSASPVSFAGNVINLNYGIPANVFGGNLLLMLDLGYAIYGGDVNQDGYIDTGDGTDVDNDQFNFMGGYVVTDVNGDGFVDTADGTIIDNNQFNFAGSILP